MFPHTITIFHHAVVDNKDVYTRKVVSGFYWYGHTGIVTSGKGQESDDSITIISSPENAKTFGKKWTVQKDDRIVKGECPDISSFKDLNGKEAVTVMKVEPNVCGSLVDNVTITGK